MEVNFGLFASLLNKRTMTLSCYNMEELKDELLEKFSIPGEFYYCVSDGKIIRDNFDHGKPIHIIPRLCGGKGGFGSMLRAIGAQIEKTTNREACRDLSGRRLRDINEEQRLKKWISQQAEREREAEEKRKKRLEKLASEPKHEFKDEKYDAERSELSERISDSVEQGFKASGSGVKRVLEEPEKQKKKMKKTILDEISSSSDTDEERDSLEMKDKDSKK